MGTKVPLKRFLYRKYGLMQQIAELIIRMIQQTGGGHFAILLCTNAGLLVKDYERKSLFQ